MGEAGDERREMKHRGNPFFQALEETRAAPVVRKAENPKRLSTSTLHRCDEISDLGDRPVRFGQNGYEQLPGMRHA